MVLPLALGTLSVLLSQLVVASALVGIGLTFRRWFGPRGVQLDDCLIAFWTGLGLVALLLMLWNFVLPITDAVAVIVLTAGAAGLLLARDDLGRVFELEDWRPSLPLLLVFLLVSLWIANLSLGPLSNYDSGVYHIQAVRWAEAYPAVPGIGNLDGHLAFNNANILFAAMLSAGPWEARSEHLANGVLVLVFVWQTMLAGARIRAGAQQRRLWFDFFLLAAVTNLAITGGISSFTTDLGTTLVLLAAASLMFAVLSTDALEPGEAAFSLLSLSLLLSTAVTFKLSSGPFVAVSFMTACALWYHQARTDPVRRRRALLRATALVGVFAVVWMGRGVVLSGYPAFPASLAGFPVDWRVPEEHAAAESAYILHGGRASVGNLAVVAGREGPSSWLPQWSRKALENPFNLVLPAALSVLGFLTFLAWRPAVWQRRSVAHAWWLLPPLVVATLAWFILAPDSRFAAPYFWALGALCGSQAIGVGRLRVVPTLVVVGLFGLSPPVVLPLLSNGTSDGEQGRIETILRANLNGPGDDSWFQSPALEPRLTTYRTRSGLELNTVSAQCWDAPLPCTANPAPNLRLRNPPDLARGFAVDGEWQMENWPLDWLPEFLPAWRTSRARRGDDR